LKIGKEEIDMLQVRQKQGVLEAIYLGRWVYPNLKWPNNNWTQIDDKYAPFANQDNRLEVLSESKEVIKEDTSKDKIDEIKVIVNNNKVINSEELISEILNAHWTQAKKKILEISDIDFLKKLLPSLEMVNKDVLIKVVKEKIEELNG
jgi:hypothetical protein